MLRQDPKALPKKSSQHSVLFRGDDFLPLFAELVYAKSHDVSGLEKNRRRFHSEADTRRRAGDDDVPRLHHEKLRAVPDEMFAIEDHRLRISALAFLTVDVEPHVEVLRILDFVLGDEPRTDRSEGLAALALVPLAAAAFDLEDALRHIVAEEISCNGVLRLIACKITGALADDDAKLDLPVKLADSRGMMVSSFGPQMQVGALLKIIGSLGMAMPASAAWSE